MSTQYNIVDIFQREETLQKLYQVFQEIQKNLPLVTVDLVNVMAKEAMNIWKSEAQKTSKWGDKYEQAIQMEPALPGGQAALIYIDEKEIDRRSDKPLCMFVTMTEDGVKAWSIKDALLASKKAKTYPNGTKYIIVPFPWRTPGLKKGTKMAAKFQGRMIPQNIYELIKENGRIPQWQSYGHMAGMTRYEKSHHTQYFTFRTVTEKSRGWHHPGHAATPVFPKVLRMIDKMISLTLHNFLKGMANEYSN